MWGQDCPDENIDECEYHTPLEEYNDNEDRFAYYEEWFEYVEYLEGDE